MAERKIFNIDGQDGKDRRGEERICAIRKSELSMEESGDPPALATERIS